MGLPEYDPSLPNSNRGPGVLYAVWILIGLSSVVLAARLWTKIRKTHKLYYDDWVMIVALIFGLVHAGTVTLAIQEGFGRHVYLSPDEVVSSIRAGFLTVVWGNMSPVFGRTSFCITLLFLTRTDPQVKRWPIWIFISFQVLINIAAIVLFYGQCGTQLDIFWTPSKHYLFPTHCWNPDIQTDFGYFVGSFNCFTDAFLAVLPAILIKHTNLSLRRKIGLTLLLCLSVVALAAAVIKTYSMKVLSEVQDFTYALCFYFLWSSVELNVVIIVASIPLLRPLFHRRHPPIEADTPAKWDTTTFGSVFSKRGTRATSTKLSSSSEENIMPQRFQQYEMSAPGISVTTEVSVTYEPSDVPFVHAALVGLIQGEIANPRLAQK